MGIFNSKLSWLKVTLIVGLTTMLILPIPPKYRNKVEAQVIVAGSISSSNHSYTLEEQRTKNRVTLRKIESSIYNIDSHEHKENKKSVGYSNSLP